MAWSSPRASAGLRMLEASMAPSAAPAPMMVCISSMKRMTSPEVRISSITFFRRSSNSPRNLEPATRAPRSRVTTRLSMQRLGHVAFDDLLGQPLGDGRLADARLADEARVVLGAARQDLDHPLDLLLPADDGSSFPSRASSVRSRPNWSSVGVLRPRDDLAAAGEPPPKSSTTCLPHLVQIGAQVLEHLGGDALALPDQAQQDVLGADVGVAQLARLVKGQLQHPLGPGREADLALRASRRRGRSPSPPRTAPCPG